ncbi:LOW QUALITY PROTEIN: putative two-component response regulator ARR19 [Raphanus sativus]|uniref:LOW QUALITY PROTEIN: putative two-component response regulator ARR19 n=1 Tax=Raphanus sativus TaxID=3726 RepID=A0A6J0KRU3_RAPSA|nr:LOW QUALITY PROTEIN: putative two-component response regulator ARR19 [Raphanus sativus]
MMIKSSFYNIKSFLLLRNKIHICSSIHLSLAFFQTSTKVTFLMSIGNITEDGDNTLLLQQETSKISSPLSEFPPSTNVLVVDASLSTLLNMKEIMERCAYQVTAYADAEEAIAFLTNSKHEINIVIWDYHMPGINGLQALAIIGSKMDLPVVIMCDDDQTELVMDAMVHGACHYVMKPIRKEIIATMWQHIVRKRMISKPGLVPPIVAHYYCSKQEKDDYVSVDQDDCEQNIDKIEEEATNKRRRRCIGKTHPMQSDLVKSNDSEQDSNDFRSVSNYNGEQSIDKKKERYFKKQRMLWTADLQQKFLEAINIVGGPKNATPKLLLKCLQDMKIEGLTRNNVSSHLQKYRLSLEQNKIPQQLPETGWSSLCRPSSFLGMNNGFIAPSSLINGPAVYPVQENQYQNGYLAMNNNHFLTNNMPGFPYLNNDHHLQQQHQQRQYQLPNQVNYMMRRNENQQAYNGISLTDLESSIYPSLPNDPNEFLFNGYNFSN